MLNIGGGELALILVIALLVLGPQRLPELARGIGKFYREFRKQTDEVRTVVEREFYRMDQDVSALPVPSNAAARKAELAAKAAQEKASGKTAAAVQELGAPSGDAPPVAGATPDAADAADDLPKIVAAPGVMAQGQLPPEPEAAAPDPVEVTTNKPKPVAAPPAEASEPDVPAVDPAEALRAAAQADTRPPPALPGPADPTKVS